MSASNALKHVRNYASAGVLSAFAGIVTFPLLTRSLSVAEYGVLGLITASLTLFVAIGKLGMQHAVIRYYAQIKNANLKYNLEQMNSTVTSMFVLFAAITTVLWLMVGYVFMPNHSDFDNISTLFLVASGLVFLRLLNSCAMNFLRAQQRSAIVGFTVILVRYLYLGSLVLVVLFTEVTVMNALLTMLVAEIVGVIFAAKQYWPTFDFSAKSIVPGLGKSMLVYGIPLMILESLGLVMRLSDRYLIQGLLGENELGMYSASYSLTSYIDLIILTALVQAIKPHYMQLWESDGKEKTKEFLTSGFHCFVVIGIPIVALFSLVSPHMLNALASPKYLPGTIIIPFVAFSFMLEGSMHFLAAGIYIRKRTKVLMFWGFVATLLNLALNLALIPIYGILGAALVTIASYLVFMLGVSYRAFEILPFTIKPLVPLLITMFSLLVYAMLFKIDLGGDIINLIVKGTLGGTLLVLIVLICDKQTRDWAFNRFNLRRAIDLK